MEKLPTSGELNSELVFTTNSAGAQVRPVARGSHSARTDPVLILKPTGRHYDMPN